MDRVARRCSFSEERCLANPGIKAPARERSPLQGALPWRVNATRFREHSLETDMNEHNLAKGARARMFDSIRQALNLKRRLDMHHNRAGDTLAATNGDWWASVLTRALNSGTSDCQPAHFSHAKLWPAASQSLFEMARAPSRTTLVECLFRCCQVLTPLARQPDLGTGEARPWAQTSCQPPEACNLKQASGHANPGGTQNCNVDMDSAGLRSPAFHVLGIAF